ncbi:MAG: UvrD-helicase domain-containing protein [Planctomycetota bacterium]
MTQGNASCVLMASAGTGKTFQLSNRYLRLAQQGVDVERILASTFTRKAAGEILGAILGRLAVACSSEEEFLELSEHLDLTDCWTREDAMRLLRDLLRKMPSMQVSTLDSWFQRQARAAAFDLGLPLGWRLADDVEWRELHDEAVEKALEGRPAEQMVTLLAAMQGGRSGRSVLRQASELWEKAAHHWEASHCNPQAWSLLDGVERPNESQWQVGINAFRSMPIPKTGKGAPNKFWADAHRKNLQALENRDWSSAFGNGILKSAAASILEYRKKPIDPQYVSALVDCYHRQLLSDLHATNKAFMQMAAVYQETFEQLQDRSHLLYHDDFPKLLGAVSADTRAVVDARTGPAADHLLLDEFQDTSVGQWHALDHPVRQALAAQEQGDGSVFIVGDIKQSIYGFREGEPRLLAGVAGWLDLPSEAMATNYRSQQGILDAVNAVFETLKKVYGASDSPILHQGLQAWMDFPHHQAKEQGDACFRVIEAQEDKELGVSIKEALLQTIVARTVALHRIYPEQSLAILVRGNKEIPILLAHLSAAGVRASMSGGNALTDARAVDVALSLLHLADHPGDTASYFHVATSPFASLLELDLGKGDKIRSQASALSRRVRRMLLQDGYASVLEQWMQGMRQGSLFDAWNLTRFEQLVELAEAWDAKADLRPSRFVSMVRETKVPDADVTKVQVMTVHQSKGLAFDIVLLPMKPDRRHPKEFLSMRPDPRGPLTAVSRRPNEQHLAAAEAFGCREFLDAHVASDASDLNEDLCVLYVAMTRAKRQMELILPKPPKNRKHNPDWIPLTALLRDGLLHTESPVPPDAVPTSLHRGGSFEVLWQTHRLESVHLDLPDLDAAPLTQEPLDSILASGVQLSASMPLLAPAQGLRSLPRWTPSGAAEEGGTTRAIDLFASADDTARRRGTAIHRLYEEIHFLEDFRIDRAALIALLLSLEQPTSAEEAEAWCEDFLQGLEHQAVRDALTQPVAEGARFLLHRELPFSVATVDPHGQSAILQGIFDRVVLQEQDGRIVGAEVLDFKTGKAPADGSLSNSYRAQLEAYRRALSVQHGIDETAVACRLLFVDDGVSVALEG